MRESLIYLQDFGTKLYRQFACIPMGTNCVPLIADFFLFCHEKKNHNFYFEGKVNQISLPELQLTKANVSDTGAPFWIYNYVKGICFIKKL